MVSNLIHNEIQSPCLWSTRLPDLHSQPLSSSLTCLSYPYILPFLDFAVAIGLLDSPQYPNNVTLTSGLCIPCFLIDSRLPLPLLSFVLCSSLLYLGAPSQYQKGISYQLFYFFYTFTLLYFSVYHLFI